MPWCEIAKYEIAKITNKYFRDKLQNFAPAKTSNYTVCV